MMTRTILIGAALCGMAGAEAVRSGKAEVEWLAASANYEAGKPVETILRMKLDDGWHTYWSNPGEGGMKLSITWKLPEGWKAGEVGYPVPIRFMTGDLPGFGYEGTVDFPITITPPDAADGAVSLQAEVSWLTCNDSSCVPGDAELSLKLEPGPEAATPEVLAIAEAKKKIPQAAPESHTLKVVPSGKSLELTIQAPVGFDLAACEIFPLTEQAVDAGTTFDFKKSESGWTATVAVNEYADGPPTELALVIAGKGVEPPMIVTWKAE